MRRFWGRVVWQCVRRSMLRLATPNSAAQLCASRKMLKGIMSKLVSVKRMAKGFIASSGLLSLGTSCFPRAAIILAYHSIGENTFGSDSPVNTGQSLTLSAFEQQMELVARRFRPVTMDDILRFVSGESQLPAGSVAVTFDDGYADNFTRARPVLNRLGIRGAFYVTVASVDSRLPPWFARLRTAFETTPRGEWRDETEGTVWTLCDAASRAEAYRTICRRVAATAGIEQDRLVAMIEADLDVDLRQPCDQMMTWDQIRQMHAEGHVIGSHTLTHPNLAHIGPDVLRQELEQSKRRLQAELGTEMAHFSYPCPTLKPHWTVETVAVSREVGYRTAVIADRGAVRRGNDPLALRRVFPSYTVDDLLWKLQVVPLGFHF